MKTTAFAVTLFALLFSSDASDANTDKRYLYVAVPGIRNYLEFGGHGLLVFDIDNNHKFVKRIPTAGVDDSGKPLNVKGICASAATKRLHITTIKTLMCIDLLSEKLLWEKSYEGGCDRMALSPDGKIIYLPSLEKDHWHVVDALSGDVIKRLEPKSGAHNTIYGPDGKWVYLAGLKSPILSIADTKDHAITRRCGPFGNSVRPFTINSKQKLAFVNVNELLGFEVGDLVSGKKLHRVEVEGFSKGPIKRHGCPSHGIGLTPDEKELWISDAANERMHIFDATVMPPKQVASIKVREQPGWITFSLNGTYAYPSTGDIVDVKTRKIIAGLTDETGRQVHSEKMVEVHFRGKDPVRSGDQFGIGRKELCYINMMLKAEVAAHVLEDDGKIPNSKLPLLIYRAAVEVHGKDPAAVFEKLFPSNRWHGTWRNGIYTYHHYHSTAHEVLGVYAGEAKVQLGGEKGIVTDIRTGDVVIIPAGVGHINLGASHDFGVVGAYPEGQDYDMCYGKPEERPRAVKNIAQVPKPKSDPVFGDDGPLLSRW